MAFGPYELLRLIAAGGMARVYEARLTGPHGFVKRLAIKMMLPELAGDADFVAMLIDEAKIAVKLAHANICQVLDLGLIDGRYYIAMEYVDGADLNRVVNRALQEGVPIPFDVVSSIGADICAGLDYAHAKVDEDGYPLRIVHRDISPANILLSLAGEVKIVDFGVAKAASRSQHTTVGVVKGKYQYMSPEQVSGGVLDHRTDIFSTGIVLYETIAGQMMYPEGPDLLERIRLAAMRPLDQVRPAVPRELSEIIGKALSRRPQDRFQTAGQLGAVLTEFTLRWRTRQPAERLGALMTVLFGQEKRFHDERRRDSSPPLSRAELIDRGGSLVRSQIFADETHAAFGDEDVDAVTSHAEPPDMSEAPTRRPPLETDGSSPRLPEPASQDDVDIDVDLTFVDSRDARPASTLYMVRDPEGRTSGPFSRAQLHELVLSGDITENDEVLPVSGSGVEDDGGTVRWVPASGHLPPGTSGLETRMPLRLGTPARATDLAVQSTARVLLDLGMAGTTGVAVFDRPGAHKEVTLVGGRPSYASSNQPAEQLGERLVRLGLVTRAGLGQGLQAASRDGTLLGQALVDLGMIEPPTLERCLVGLVRARLLDLFLWRTGSVTVHPGLEAHAPIELALDPLELVLEGVEHAAGSEGAVGWLLDLEDRALVLSGEPRTKLEMLGTREDAFRFLERFTHPTRVRDVLDAVTGHDMEGAQIARALMLAAQIGYLVVISDQIRPGA
jgi:serine/threonine protein kinase